MDYKKTKTILYDFFDKNLNATFEEVIRGIPRIANKLKYSELKEIYYCWRKDYIKKLDRFELMELEDFCYFKSINSRKFTSPYDIKEAIILKRTRKFKSHEIAEITGISITRLNNLFADANTNKLLDGCYKVQQKAMTQ